MGISKLGITSVPTYFGKAIVNHVVISSKMNPCYWQYWDCFKSELDSKDLGNSFLCFATHVLKGEAQNLPVLVPRVSGLDMKNPRNFALFFATLSPMPRMKQLTRARRGMTQGSYQE